jgi:hypothetical protein
MTGGERLLPGLCAPHADLCRGGGRHNRCVRDHAHAREGERLYCATSRQTPHRSSRQVAPETVQPAHRDGLHIAPGEAGPLGVFRGEYE